MNGDAFNKTDLARRSFLKCTGFSFGALALSALMEKDGFARSIQEKRTDAMAPKPPHFSPRAKAVIYLNMTGAPSQIDAFDLKPKLFELDGKPVPDEFMAGQRFAFIAEGARPNVLAPLWKIEKRGQCGAPVTEHMPFLSGVVDDLTFIRSMVTDEINHVPAQLLMESGSPRMGRPAMGSWVTYGLGSICEDLPGYVVLTSGKAGRCGTTCWGSGFLPSVYQGIQFRSEGDPVLFLSDPPGLDRATRREIFEAVGAIDREAAGAVGDPEMKTRIAAYEMAAKMQTSVPKLADFSDEPESIKKLYGVEPGKTSFSNNCLLARRLVERGVRFVQLAHGGWDHHGGGDQNLVTGFPERCRQTDQGAAALITDLKQRGLLDQVLVLWGGEFGRTPIIQGAYNKADLGRDHLRSAFTVWLAGGGTKRGFSFGETDLLGMSVTKDKVHVHDLQATLLHLLGLDHKRLTFRFQGRDFRLTDVAGDVVRGVLA